ncbi:MAG: FHA domain-containing protein [Anaerolineae bacterium]
MQASDDKQKVICPSCGIENLLGTLFCVDCGTYLPSGGPLRTEPLPEKEEKAGGPKREPETSSASDVSMRIELAIPKSERRIMLSADSEILFGRLDAAHGIFPEVDLTAEGGLEDGVSRRHARIYRREGRLFIEDLDSTNGTFLNDDRLEPYVPCELHDGDTLTLGVLGINVHIHTAD